MECMGTLWFAVELVKNMREFTLYYCEATKGTIELPRSTRSLRYRLGTVIEFGPPIIRNKLELALLNFKRIR